MPSGDGFLLTVILSLNAKFRFYLEHQKLFKLGHLLKLLGVSTVSSAILLVAVAYSITMVTPYKPAIAW